MINHIPTGAGFRNHPPYHFASEASQVLDLDPWGGRHCAHAHPWQRTIITIPYGRSGISMDKVCDSTMFLPHFPITNEDKKHLRFRGARALFAGIDVPGCEPAHLTVVAIVRQVDLGSDAHNFASAFWGENMELVGGAITILKNMKVNGKDDNPYMKWKIRKCLKPSTREWHFCCEKVHNVTTNMGISPTKKGRPQLMDFDNPT